MGRTIARLAVRVAALVLLLNCLIPSAYSEITSPGSYERLRQQARSKLRNRLEPLVARYCGDACEYIDSEVEIEESFQDIEDLGFESVVEDQAENTFYVKKVIVKVQVDGRVTSSNRARLEEILLNRIVAIGYSGRIEWLQIRLPRIGGSKAAVDNLKRRLRTKLDQIVERVIQHYCPEQCLHGRTVVAGTLVTPDEAESVSSLELIEDPATKSILKLENIQIDMEFDESLPSQERESILSILRARTRFVSPVSITQRTTRFPESAASKSQRLAKEAEDPYGLEKLRRMLTLFRDLAGTKEVITSERVESDSKSETQSKSESLSETETKSKSSEVSSLTSEEKSRSELQKESGLEGDPWIPGVPNWVVVVAGIFALLIIVAGIVVRLASAKRDAQIMMDMAARPREQPNEPREDGFGGAQPGHVGIRTGSSTPDQDLHLRLQVDELKEELVDVFVNNPKVARETYGRMIHEEGVEKVSKYVHIFGHLVVLELLDDQSLSRELYELSEYFHRSEFDFGPEETLDLLIELRTKLTASKIKVLSQKVTDQFKFLSAFDSSQVYGLISDERAMVQGIVLTQVDHKLRRAVFDLFTGKAKVDLMHELCRADAIPKDYLINVARALHRKVTSKPQFDTENIRSSDILLDLLDKSTLDEQRQLMGNLSATNPDAARAIKQKLVTIEMLGFLKDGHLLEIILGLDRESLLTFLAGTRDHIRQLLLAKAPEELAESWMEELAIVSAVDENRYQMAELQIIGRLRSLAASGMINLLEINEILFADIRPEDSGGGEGAASFNQNHLIA